MIDWAEIVVEAQHDPGNNSVLRSLSQEAFDALEPEAVRIALDEVRQNCERLSERSTTRRYR